MVLHCPAEKTHKAFPEIDVVWRGAYIASKTIYIPFKQFIVPSKTFKLPIPYALMHPRTIRDAGFLTGTADTHLESLPPFSQEDTASMMARRIVFTGQWFLEVFLGPFSNFNDRIMPMSNAVSSEGPKTMAIKQIDLFYLYEVSLNLLMMLCTVDVEICKVFAIWCWEMLFLKYSTIFLMHSFTDWRTSSHLYFWETLSL